jgi:hypothetical protein
MHRSFALLRMTARTYDVNLRDTTLNTDNRTTAFQQENITPDTR